MMLRPGSTGGKQVLTSLLPGRSAPRWLGDLGIGLRPAGLSIMPAYSESETIARIERGNLAAAIVVADDRQTDGVSLLRIIRSIDGVLPCWLVATDPTRQSLQTALSLHVRGVITHPIDVGGLTLALLKAVTPQGRDS